MPSIPVLPVFPPAASEETLGAFLEAFESGTLPRASWTHAAHVAMAGCYLTAFPREEAARRIRDGILRYNASVGIVSGPDSGYHETLTEFWIRITSRFLAGLPPATGRLAAIRSLVEATGHRAGLFREYYSYDVVKSRAARASWEPPDLLPLDSSF